MRMSRRVDAVGETAVDLVELHRRDAEIEQGPGHAGFAGQRDRRCRRVEVRRVLRIETGDDDRPVDADDVGETVEPGLDADETIAETGEPLAGGGQCGGVTVEADQVEARKGFQEVLGVAAGAEGAVDDDGAGSIGGTNAGDAGLEEGGDAIEEDRDVTVLAGLAISGAERISRTTSAPSTTPVTSLTSVIGTPSEISRCFRLPRSCVVRRARAQGPARAEPGIGEVHQGRFGQSPCGRSRPGRRGESYRTPNSESSSPSEKSSSCSAW